MLKIRDCVIAGLCLAVTSLIIENAHAGENPTETATSRIGKMKVGQKVKIEVDAYKGKDFEGKTRKLKAKVRQFWGKKYYISPQSEK